MIQLIKPKYKTGVWDRVYPEFEPGSEVVCLRNYKKISKRKTYIVVRCYKLGGMIKDYPGRMVEVKTDIGFLSSYASDAFKPSDRQLRTDKINEIIE